MYDPLPLAGDVIAGGAALAGLILVYLGSVSTSFDSFDKVQQNAVRGTHRLRAWSAVCGIVLAFLASLLALGAKWFGLPCMAGAAIVLLAVAIIWAAVCAILIAKDIG